MQKYTREQLISWIEQADSSGVSPFRIVETVQGCGYSRLDAIELYRVGAHAWTVGREEQSEEV